MHAGVANSKLFTELPEFKKAKKLEVVAILLRQHILYLKDVLKSNPIFEGVAEDNRTIHPYCLERVRY